MNMFEPLLEKFSEQKDCIYKGERYSVRDNGAVLRHIRPDKKKRPLDSQWTFGKLNPNTGYLEIATTRIHRIVATAFHGESPGAGYVVDHIDTNRQNNRPENLRWLTRLENILKNPITCKKIESLCGSVENFLKDPSLLSGYHTDPNFNWMRTVTKEEAANCLKNMQQWLSKKTKDGHKSTLGEWVFRNNHSVQNKAVQTLFTASLTPGAVQENWRIPVNFLCLPKNLNIPSPLSSYFANLQIGMVFCSNSKYGNCTITNLVKLPDNSCFWVITYSQISTPKSWILIRITYNDEKFIHAIVGSFFEERGAEKALCLAQGQEWRGEDGIDDYC